MVHSTLSDKQAVGAKSHSSVDLNSETQQQRLSSSALKGFFNLVSKWRVRDEDARELLGGISSSRVSALDENSGCSLEIDQITRVSFLVGTYKALHLLYGDKLADEWVTLPNKNPVFAGSTPLQYMLCNGLMGIEAVRKLLDARLDGGPWGQTDRSNEYPVLNGPQGIHHGG